VSEMSTRPEESVREFCQPGSGGAAFFPTTSARVSPDIVGTSFAHLRANPIAKLAMQLARLADAVSVALWRYFANLAVAEVGWPSPETAPLLGTYPPVPEVG
jgi:hypothetical protein